jgi:hypothetical protein
MCEVAGLLGYNHFCWREWSRRNRAINGHNVASDPSQIRFQCMHLLNCSSCFIFFISTEFYILHMTNVLFSFLKTVSLYFLYAHLSSLYLLLQIVCSLGSCSQTFCSINNRCGVCMVFSPLHCGQFEAEFKKLAKASRVCSFVFFLFHSALA